MRSLAAAAAFAGALATHAVAQITPVDALPNAAVLTFEDEGFVGNAQFETPRTFNGAGGIVTALDASLDDNADPGGPGTWSFADGQWGLLTSGQARTISGQFGIGVDTIQGGFLELAFDNLLTGFGGYFAAPTDRGSYGDPNAVRIFAYDENNTELGFVRLDYSRSKQVDGQLLWLGFTSDVPVSKVIIRSQVFVMDDLHMQIVPEPGTAAALVLAGLAFPRRRR